MYSRQAKTGDKRMSLSEAVEKFIPDGSYLHIGGHGGGRSFCTVFEIIRQHKKHLTVSGMGMWQDMDILVGAGVADRIECSWHGLETGLSVCIRRAVEKGLPHPIEYLETSHFSNTCRLMASALGLPFMPTKSLFGSDMLEWAEKEGIAAVIEDPFTGEKVVAMKALEPDVGIMHVQKADMFGNCQVWGYLGDDDWGNRACKHLIVTCEELVDSKELMLDPNRVLIPGFMVDAVVEVPKGSHPWGVTGYYKNDQEFVAEYIAAAKDEEKFAEYLDKYIYSVKTFDEYLEKIGAERWERLEVQQVFSKPVCYGS